MKRSLQGEARPSQSVILLSTYNGSRFLATQLDSIIRQSDPDWTLLIRDDGSDDDTLGIIDRYCFQDSRITRFSSASKDRRGPKGSFSELIGLALKTDGEYFFLCDQDDSWHPDKIARQRSLLCDKESPCLVYGPLLLADEQLNPLLHKPAYDSGLLDFNHGLNGLLSLNSIPGCAMAFNRQLAELVFPVPEVALMHDWWIALTAAASGEIIRTEEPLGYYRQHENNAIGGPSLVNLASSFKNWLTLWQKGGREFFASIEQVHALAGRLEGYDGHLGCAVEDLNEYARLATLGRWERIRVANRLRLRKGKPLQRAVLYARLMGRIA